MDVYNNGKKEVLTFNPNNDLKIFGHKELNNYINVDVSLYLHRNPEGNWIGTETSYHGADNGTAIGTVTLYDKMGNIGTATVCGLTQTRI